MNLVKRFSVALCTWLILIVGCDNEQKAKKWKEYWITGTLETEGYGVDTIFFHDCYCNLVNSTVKINYVYFGGVEGGHLTATVSSADSVKIDISYMLSDFRTFSYDKKLVEVDQLNPMLGDTITGSIALKGESHGRRKELYKFDLKGNLRCILRDSTYTFEVFYQDLLDHRDSLGLLRLKEIAHSNSDSVTELWLTYKHSGMIKDDLNRFKKLEKLSLSEFPSLEGWNLPAFKALRELSIHSDSLRELPTDLAAIPELEVLNVTAPITFVPQLYKMTKLKKLDLSGTKVSQVSDSVILLSRLQTLNLLSTDIIRVPENIFHMEHLVELYLPDTLMLSKIKTWRLKSLRRLDIPYDYLMHNRQIIGDLSNLEWLYISDYCVGGHDCVGFEESKEAYFEGLLPEVGIQVRSR